MLCHSTYFLLINQTYGRQPAANYDGISQKKHVVPVNTNADANLL
jgi:hypothetical protein